MRVTSGSVNVAFQYLCKVLEKRVATSHIDVGAWYLGYIPGGLNYEIRDSRGRYRIEEITDEHGTRDKPFGDIRYSGAELYNLCWFAIRAVEMDRRERKTK